MTPTLVNAQTTMPQAWRNGGGWTRELLTWPPGPDWRVRISRADIEADGPFSGFPGVERWFVVLKGAGVALQFANDLQYLKVGDAPLRFDGGLAPGCRLINGPTQDLNLMTRQGSGVMLSVQNQHGWSAPCASRGLYTVATGVWRNGGQTLAVPAHTLLWFDKADPHEWAFSPSDAGIPLRAWWLGYTPG
jgi:environmental stress-induced protein Ves